MFVLGYISLFWALIRLGLLSGDAGPKSFIPTIPPFFLAGEFDFSRLEKYYVFDLVIVGNGGPLKLACSNMHVSGECSIFGISFSTTF